MPLAVAQGEDDALEVAALRRAEDDLGGFVADEVDGRAPSGGAFADPDFFAEANIVVAKAGDELRKSRAGVRAVASGPLLRPAEDSRILLAPRLDSPLAGRGRCEASFE